MDLILTHEHADFDAVASQLAAHKLIPDARPLLSNRLNRNVRHFLHLYRDELPFIESKDLPKEKSARAIVVDSQNVPSVKGVGKQTRVEIIDHHALREGLDSQWQVTVEQVGATTTLLVERLKESGIELTPIECTMMALGIYEDTGSLSYGTTTARDVFAAGWLVEQGAAMDVIREFLHHPLAEDQRALYEQLLEHIETHMMEGHAVVIATASAPQMVEEVATLAHKLRDLFEPAALFILVDLGSHIQMVARSSVEAVDVGGVAEHFGGGGHGRAAAAIIKGVSLEAAKAAVLDALPAAIRPGVTVAELMSHGVQTLDAATTVREAAAQMRRYGYEGFPVVSDGQIAGLVTRRAVDRAMDHGLEGLHVEKIMEAGNVSVSPRDSMATLQQVMMNSGWGQIPVVGRESEIIGVVTRTDLIKQLGKSAGAPRRLRRQEIARKMEEALPPALMALVREIGRVAQEQGLNLYVVGGFVRDLLLGQPTTDMDLVVEGDAIRLTAALKNEFGGQMRSHGRFGTGKWLLDAGAWRAIAERLGITLPSRLPEHIDFVTARTEFYRAPTALPDVEQSGIKLDLHRRDFTINTLAIRLDPPHFGELLDFYGGEADLREGRIRVLHSLSFVDDPTRILRAVRLEQRLGFQIGPRTAELIRQAVPLLDRVSGDRIRHEIDLILEEVGPEDSLGRLEELGALQTLHPNLPCDHWVRERFAALREARDLPLWEGIERAFDLTLPYFAILTYRLEAGALDAVCRRLKVRRRTVTHLERVQTIRKRMGELERKLPPSQIVGILDGTDDRDLLAAWSAAESKTAREQIVEYARRLRYIRPEIDGLALIEQGLKPGPVFKRVLDALRAAKLDGRIRSVDDEEQLLQQLLEGEIQ